MKLSSFSRHIVIIFMGAFAACQQVSGSGDDQSGAFASSSSALIQDGVDFTVAVRGTGSATVHATIFENRNMPSGVSVLALPGLTASAASYKPLAQAIFADPLLSKAVGRIIALDQPGHGLSGFPENLPQGVNFGDLLLEDEVSVVIQSINALRKLGLAPRTIMGHSAGGHLMLGVQANLLSQGSSYAAMGIFGAVALAPLPTHGQPWSIAVQPDLSPFVVADPVLGTYLQVSPEAFVGLCFTTSTGALATDALTPAEIVAGNFVTIEPLAKVLETSEVTMPRLSAPAGAFSPQNGTLLTVVSFSQDILVPAQDLPVLYSYLTGDTRDLLYREVTAPDAVHGMPFSNPSGLLSALRASF